MDRDKHKYLFRGALSVVVGGGLIYTGWQHRPVVQQFAGFQSAMVSPLTLFLLLGAIAGCFLAFYGALEILDAVVSTTASGTPDTKTGPGAAGGGQCGS